MANAQVLVHEFRVIDLAGGDGSVDEIKASTELSVMAAHGFAFVAILAPGIVIMARPKAVLNLIVDAPDVLLAAMAPNRPGPRAA